MTMPSPLQIAADSRRLVMASVPLRAPHATAQRVGRWHVGIDLLGGGSSIEYIPRVTSLVAGPQDRVGLVAVEAG